MRIAIRQARKAHGRSQLDVARDAGLTQKHISNIETGKIVPRFDTLLEIAWALDLDLVMIPKRMSAAVNSLVGGPTDYDTPNDPIPAWAVGLIDEEEAP